MQNIPHFKRIIDNIMQDVDCRLKINLIHKKEDPAWDKTANNVIVMLLYHVCL